MAYAKAVNAIQAATALAFGFFFSMYMPDIMIPMPITIMP